MTLLDRLPDLSDHTDDDGWPLCNNGLHYTTPDNMVGPNMNRCRRCVNDRKSAWLHDKRGSLRKLRYPLEPIEKLLCTTDTTCIAERLGVKPNTVRAWRERGIPEKAADRVAVHLGLTPHLVAGWEQYEDAL